MYMIFGTLKIGGVATKESPYVVSQQVTIAGWDDIFQSFVDTIFYDILSAEKLCGTHYRFLLLVYRYILHTDTILYHIMQLQLHGLICILNLIDFTKGTFRSSRAIESCESAQKKCVIRVGCGMALHNYFIGCNDVIYGNTGVCSASCRRALISLLSTEDRAGLAFVNCDCSGNELCEQQKKSVEMCDNVLEAMETLDNNSTIVSCTLARWICEADTSCFTALRFYRRHCERLFDDDKPRCTSRCNNSLSILYRQTKARKLRTCYCDGSEQYDCPALKENTERVCFQRHSKVPYQHLGNMLPEAPKETSVTCPANVATRSASCSWNLYLFYLAFCISLSWTSMTQSFKAS